MKPHPLNAPGDFYVVDGCCTTCDVPRTEAPDLFALTTSPYLHCYVRRQPETDVERKQMLSAIACAELQCIRYRGSAPEILTQISAMNELELCDNPPDPALDLGVRTHVEFDGNDPRDVEHLAASFRNFIASQSTEYSIFELAKDSSPRSTVKFRRNDDPWCHVTFKTNGTTTLATHDAEHAPDISWFIHRWLEQNPRVATIRWYTRAGWQTGLNAYPTPY